MIRSAALTKLGRQLIAKIYCGKSYTVIEIMALAMQASNVKPSEYHS